MKAFTPALLFGVFTVFSIAAQQTIVSGSVVDGDTYHPLPKVTVIIEDTSQITETDAVGQFRFSSNLPLGEQTLIVEKYGYVTKRFPIVIYEGQTLDISDMMLDIDVGAMADRFIITLSDDELSSDDIGETDNISGLLQASQDVYGRTVAFEFSPSFFKLRGLDSEHALVQINGMAMNSLFNGRPQWASWGGLNDVLRNQELAPNLTPSNQAFGGVLGATNISTRASEYRRGGRVTYSSSNRSYTNRVIASYATGLMKGQWAVAVAMGKRWGNEGFQEATFYDANSFFMALEKQINTNHSINFTAIFSPTRNGKSSPNTQEVYDLKGIAYNEYWGYHDNKKRNSRVRHIEEPILQLNHYWNLNDGTTLQTNVGYRLGKTGNSRLDYPGGSHPSAAYYQKLPSYALANPQNPDYAKAYLLEQKFLKDGQLDWNRIYDANLTNAMSGLNAAYVLYEDRNDDTQLAVNTVFTSDITDRLTVNATLDYTHLTSDNFGQVIDLLGATGVLNVDSFDQVQFDLQHPDQIVGQGDRYKYNYKLYVNRVSAFAQAQFKYKRMAFFGALNFLNSTYQREGFYQHETYAYHSLGKGTRLNITSVSAKGGLTYKMTGRHIFDFNAGFVSKPPLLKNIYTNPRENHNMAEHSTNQKIIALDASYHYRSPALKLKCTGYYIELKGVDHVSFYYADGLSGFVNEEYQTSAFVQETLQGIDKTHFGVEIGMEAQVTSAIQLKGAASIGQFTYANNPDLYLTSSRFTADVVNYGPASLKNYKVAGGPQTAYSVGFEYRDPEYWWFGATVNFFDNTYVDINPLVRTRNFYLDADGLPFNDYDPDVAKQLLKQEKFDNYMVMNLIGGKSWRINNYFVGVFMSINNVFNTTYKTGGFEQGRNANYRELNADASRELPLFGAKYWYGRGTTYFLNAYIRF